MSNVCSGNSIFGARVGSMDPVSQFTVSRFLLGSAFCFYILETRVSHTQFTSVLGLSIGSVENLLQVVIVGLLLLKIVLFDHLNLREWAIAAVLMGVGLAAWRTAGESWVFWLAMFVTCGKQCRIKDLAVVMLVTSSLVFVVTVLFAQGGAIESIALARDGVQETRSSLGFSHPNYFGAMLMAICVSVSVIRFGKRPWLDLLLIGVCAIVALNVADSRTTVLCLSLQALLILIFYYVNGDSARLFFRWAFFLTVVMCCVISVYFMIAYSPGIAWHSAVNAIMNTRFSLAHNYYLLHQPDVFGFEYAYAAPILVDGELSRFVVDNAFCHFILRFGIVPSVFFFGGVTLLYFKAIRERSWGPCLFGLTLFLICGMSETYGVRVEQNFLLIAMASLLYPCPIENLEQGAKEPERSDLVFVDTVVSQEGA